MKLSSIATVLGLSLAAACSGGSSTKAAVDAKVTVDAPTQADAPAAGCPVSTADFGDKGALTMGFAEYSAGMADMGNPAAPNIFSQGVLAGTQAKFDALSVQLLSDYEPFGTTMAPKPPIAGTYQLTGAQTQFATCGVCVQVVGDITQSSNSNFMATGGTLKVTEVGTAVGQKFTFELTNATFQEVTINDNTFESTPKGTCTTKISRATFTATMEAQQDNLLKGPDGKRRVSFKLTRVR